MPFPAPQLQPRLRFPHDGPAAFGPDKAELLRHVAATGSIRIAAAETGMSYNRAWSLVRTTAPRVGRKPVTEPAA